MRICLVAHGFPPIEKTGVENYTAALASTLARQDQDVEVFAPRKASWLPEFSLRREQREGYGVNWLSVSLPPRDPREALESPQIAERFGSFLDRERPEVVHFQHFIKLGLGLVLEAKKRGIPTLYTAHDYYAICHRYTLLRPDLTRCDVRGDSMACARCDVALSYLNQKPKLGDYQMGALPEQLESGERSVLAEILAGTSEEPDFDQDRVDSAFDLRLDLDARRATAFGAVDCVIAPTKFLRDELVRGGLEKERIEVLPYGIENEDLLDLTPVRHASSRPVHFAFFGGMAKHKGVHVLIEAFQKADITAELSIWGYSTDRAYVRRMREAATRAKVVWRGPYEREELPALLADVDVVVVPSLWVENYPLVIREAFSAKRPVIASRLGAIPESVEHGVDGLLFEPGDADDLAAQLQAIVEDPQEIGRMAGRIQPVKDVEVQARELLERYTKLIEAAGEAREKARTEADLPASLAPFAERFAQLSLLPNRELFSRAIVRLEKLRGGLGTNVSRLGIEEILLRALGSDSRSQVVLRDSKLENAWMHKTLESREEAEQELEARLEWREDHLKILSEERDWLREEEESLAKERDWLREDRQSLAQERDWLREDRGSLTEERDWLREILDTTEVRLKEREGELTAASEERDWLRGIVEGKKKESQWLREVLEARETELGWVRERLAGVLRSHGELERLSLDLRRTLEDAEKGNRELREDLLLTEKNLETTKTNLQRVNTLLATSEKNLRLTVVGFREAQSRLVAREADLERTRESLESSEKDLETAAESLETTTENLETTTENLETTTENLETTTESLETVTESLESVTENLEATTENLVTTESNLERTEQDLTRTRSNLDIAKGNLTRVEGQLQNAAELGLVSLKAQERLIGNEILPLIEEIHELDRSEELDRVLESIPENRPELLELVRAAQVTRKRVRDLSSELEWRRDQMQDAYQAYQRRFANVVLRRTGVGRRVATWNPESDPPQGDVDARQTGLRRVDEPSDTRDVT